MTAAVVVVVGLLFAVLGVLVAICARADARHVAALRAAPIGMPNPQEEQ